MNLMSFWKNILKISYSLNISSESIPDFQHFFTHLKNELEYFDLKVLVLAIFILSNVNFFAEFIVSKMGVRMRIIILTKNNICLFDSQMQKFNIKQGLKPSHPR